MKVSVENLLETCLDTYSSFHVSLADASGQIDEEEEAPLTFEDFNDSDVIDTTQNTPNASAEEGITLHRMVNFTATAHSNPGYISNEGSPEVTEEGDLSSSYDATTISESLPRDDSYMLSHHLDFGSTSIREFPMEDDECPTDFDNVDIVDSPATAAVVVFIPDKPNVAIEVCDGNANIGNDLTEIVTSDKAPRAHDAQTTDDLI